MKSNSPWRPNDATVAAALEHTAARRHTAQGDPKWQPPTGDTWFLIRVAADEMTCLGCGDTFPSGHYCERCGQKVNGEPIAREKLPLAVPTLNYLQEGEYRL